MDDKPESFILIVFEGINSVNIRTMTTDGVSPLQLMAISDYLNERTGFPGPLIYASFLMPELQRVRQTDPDAKIMVLQHRRLPPDPVADVIALDASHVGLHFSTVTPMLLETYHNLGRQVFVYTVNESQDIQRMRNLGVDGIISDFPDRI